MPEQSQGYHHAEYADATAYPDDVQEQALNHWRESFQEMEQPTAANLAEHNVEAITEGFKSTVQLYTLTFDPTGMIALAAGIAAEIIGYVLEKNADDIRDAREGDDPADEQLRQADDKLTQAIASRDQTAVRGTLELVLNLLNNSAFRSMLKITAEL